MGFLDQRGGGGNGERRHQMRTLQTTSWAEGILGRRVNGELGATLGAGRGWGVGNKAKKDGR